MIRTVHPIDPGLRRATLLLCLLALLGASAPGCGGDSGGADEELENALDGDYDGTDAFETDLTVRDVSSGLANGAPVQDTCSGSIDVTIDSLATPVVQGTGSCLTSANSATYVLEGDFDEPEGADVSGDITITFSAVQHVVPFTGSIVGDELSVTFVGTTSQTPSIVIDWDGSFTATRSVQ